MAASSSSASGYLLKLSDVNMIDAHTGRLGGAEAGQGRGDALAANPPPGDLDHRAEVARERAPAGRVQPEHRDDVPAQVPPAGRHDDRRLQLRLPPPLRAIDRPQLAAGRVLQDLPPDQLRLGQREAHPAAVQHRRVAGHHVGAADDRHAPVPPGIRREVQGAMELVALHAHQRQQRPAAPGPPEQRQVSAGRYGRIRRSRGPPPRVPPSLAGVMLRTYGTVLLGMNPHRKRST